MSAPAPVRFPTERKRLLATYSFDVRLHLLVRKAAKLGLEIPQVVNGTTAVRGRDNLLSGLTQLFGHGSPGGFNSGNRVDKGAIHLWVSCLGQR